MSEIHYPSGAPQLAVGSVHSIETSRVIDVSDKELSVHIDRSHYPQQAVGHPKVLSPLSARHFLSRPNVILECESSLAVNSDRQYFNHMPTLHHYDNLGTARFVTFSCYRRLPALNDDLAKKILINCLDEVGKKHNLKLLGYVLMPEHVHLVLHPPDGTQLGLVVREIKSLSARKYFAKRPAGPPGAKRVFWMPRCYDHNCRTQETTIEKINYCHNNPVKRGLVESPGDWNWSSHNWYKGATDVPLIMDVME